MKTTSFRGRDFLSETDWSREEIETILALAEELKLDRAKGKYHDDLLRAKTLFMIFYNQSLRTRNSFEAGMTQLGGHAHYLDPSKFTLRRWKATRWLTPPNVSRMWRAVWAAWRCYCHSLLWRSGGLGVRRGARHAGRVCALG